MPSHRLRSLLTKLGLAAPKAETNPEEWKSRAQEGEFQFHKKNEWRKTDDFLRQTDALFRHFDFTPGQYAGKLVLDLGAGSKLRAKFFEGARIIAIEPLADRFLQEIEWCDLRDAERVYSNPAEERIEELVGRVDLLFSINVLDHCFSFPQIVRNIRDYLNPDGGLAFLSFDKHEHTDDMHPLVLTEPICERIFAEAGLRIEKSSTGAGTVLGGAQTYGHGKYCLNYWLRRA